ncbi:MAG: hypothetical protein IPM98_14110 [Lewinellaceae bacterium]|nr:hypothetical protein [Lewinellaceae bacterium]
MKNMTFLLPAALLVLLSACNRIDNAYVEQIQTGMNKTREHRATFETSAQSCTKLFEKMLQVPEGVKNNPKFGYEKVYSEVVFLNRGCASMITAQDEMVSRLEAILGEYTDGKVKKEDVLQETQNMLSNVEGYEKRIEMVGKRLDAASAAYDKIMSEWAATPEAEKIASAAMPPPVLPDAATERSSSPLPTSIPSSQPNAGGASQTQPGALTPTSPGAIAPKQDGQKQ